MLNAPQYMLQAKILMECQNDQLLSQIALLEMLKNQIAKALKELSSC